jgi:hypothetical protein
VSVLVRAVLVSLVLAGQPAADPAPLPDARALADTAARRMRESFKALGQHTYDVHEREEELDSKGRVNKTTTRAFEVFYVLGRPVRRQVSENGVEFTAKQRADEDRRVEKRVAEIRRKRPDTESEGEAERKLGEALARFDLRCVGREEVDGRTTVVLTLAALPGDREIEGDKYLRKLAGRFWVDEQESQLVRAEVHTTSSIKVGLGVLASVSEAQASFAFAKVAEDTWLPSRIETRGKGRILLFKGFHARNTLTYGRFRRFAVETMEQTRPLP